MLNSIIDRMHFLKAFKNIDDVQVYYALDKINDRNAESLKDMIDLSFKTLIVAYHVDYEPLLGCIDPKSYVITNYMSHVEITENYDDTLGLTLLGECQCKTEDGRIHNRFFRMAFEFVGEIELEEGRFKRPLVTSTVGSGLDIRPINQ